MVDKSGETESVSSDDAFQAQSSPSLKPDLYKNFEITHEPESDNFTITFEKNNSQDRKFSLKKSLTECKEFQTKLEPAINLTNQLKYGKPMFLTVRSVHLLSAYY